MRNALVAFTCLLSLGMFAGRASAQVATSATITASKVTLANAANQPPNTKGIRVDGQFNCGIGKAVPPGQPDLCDRIEVYVYRVVRVGRTMTLTLIDQDINIKPGAIQGPAPYSSKRFDLDILDVNNSPYEYRVDILLFINGQATQAATTFIPPFTL